VEIEAVLFGRKLNVRTPFKHGGTLSALHKLRSKFSLNVS
jgi:hypothetical protein